MRILFGLSFIVTFTCFAQDEFEQEPDTLRAKLRNLPWTEKELTGISEIISGDIYVREEATEDRFKASASEYGILHLATHALVDDREPLFSKLIFSKKKGSEEDGYLYTYEIYNLNINANLVVLSACNTGIGPLIGGEGLMSLARAFVYAGCHSILMSLWPIDDKSTAVMMKDFYKGLSENKTRSEALRDAKITLLKSNDPVFSNPYYWSGLVLIGDTGALHIETPRRSLLPWIIVATLFVIGGAVLSRVIHYRRPSNP